MEVTLKTFRKPPVSNGMLGMIFFLSVEVMLFAGFISAYMVNRSSAASWPPFGQPRLPIEVTLLNTLVLLASGITLFLFRKKFITRGERSLLVATLILGTLFLTIQGTEWAKLIGFGLTTSSSLYGAFFYMIIGAHAAHAVAGIIILYYLFRTLQGQQLTEGISDRITVYSLYWYFVVGIWPLLYLLVYLM